MVHQDEKRFHDSLTMQEKTWCLDSFPTPSPRLSITRFFVYTRKGNNDENSWNVLFAIVSLQCKK